MSRVTQVFRQTSNKTLQVWFRSHLSWTMGLVLVCLGLISFVQFCLSYHQQKISAENISHRLQGALSIGLLQQNRALLEIALRNAYHELNAEVVVFCEGDIPLVVFPLDARRSCSPREGFWSRALVVPVVGRSDGRAVLLVSRFAALIQTLPVIVLGLLLTAIVWSILFVLKRRILRDIVSPLISSPGRASDVESDIQEIREFRENLNIVSRLQTKVEVANAMSSLASQVAHDIRSPLAALDMVLKSTAEMPEDRRLLARSSIGRIKDIANNLLESSRREGSDSISSRQNAVAESARFTFLLSSLVDSLISEKRMQFRAKIGIEIDLVLGEAAYGIFADIQPTEFKRLLSNLVNNAVEVLSESGRVTVLLGQNANEAIISVVDDGRGIPPEILARLGRRGETHGKEGGSGLGLYHARTTIESWGGRVDIDSTVGLGTTVTVRLPLARPPKWFVEKLKVESNSTIVILDDDSSIHRIWDGRFESARTHEAGVELLHFSTPLQLKDQLKSMSPEVLQKALFLVDYELLGFSETGLDLVESLNIQERSILVTSRFEEPQIRSRCERLAVQLIPKSMGAYVPIEVAKERINVDAILIDDDSLVHAMWKMAAQSAGKRLKVFGSANDFLENAEPFGREVPIYVDVSLADGVRGEAVVERLHEMGFACLWLATGYAAEGIACPSYVRGVIGKDPPF